MYSKMLEQMIFGGRLGFVEVQMHGLISTHHNAPANCSLHLERLLSVEAECVSGRRRVSSKTLPLDISQSDVGNIEEVMELKCLSSGRLRFRVELLGTLPSTASRQRLTLLSEKLNIDSIAVHSPSKLSNSSHGPLQDFRHRLLPLEFEVEDDDRLQAAAPSGFCIDVSFTYFPNHMSFPFLALSTLSESDFPLEVCEQMRQLLLLSDQPGDTSPVPEGAVVVGSRIDRELLLQTIDKLVSLHDDSPSKSPRKQRAVFLLSQGGRIDAVTAFSQTKSFLETFAGMLSQAPAISYALVEHLLTAFLETLYSAGIAERPTVSSPGSQATSYLTGEQQVLSAHQLEALKFSAALWYLQQTLLALNLTKEFHVTFRELFAIFGVFVTYDKSLSNEMSRDDLQDLLQDLGGDYGLSEVEFIADKLDAEHMGLIGFTEFVRWWCEDNPI